MLARAWISHLRKRAREAAYEDSSQGAPDAAQEPGERRGAEDRVEQALAHLDEAFELWAASARPETPIDVWRRRWAELKSVGQGDLSIAAIAQAELAERDAAFAERVEARRTTVGAALQSVGPTPDRQTAWLVAVAVSAATIGDPVALADVSATIEMRLDRDGACWRRVRDELDALRDAIVEGLQSEAGRTARTTIDKWHQRLRDRLARVLGELETAGQMTSVDRATASRVADALLRRSGKVVRVRTRRLARSEDLQVSVRARDGPGDDRDHGDDRMSPFPRWQSLDEMVGRHLPAADGDAPEQVLDSPIHREIEAHAPSRQPGTEARLRRTRVDPVSPPLAENGAGGESDVAESMSVVRQDGDRPDRRLLPGLPLRGLRARVLPQVLGEQWRPAVPRLRLEEAPGSESSVGVTARGAESARVDLRNLACPP
jgi:hypothetical protein